MKCWKCAAELADPPANKLSFRATCDKCLAWLHCCRNCKNYKPGQPNDCLIPGTDYIADREASNFCDEFVLQGSGPSKGPSRSDIERRLFGDG